MAPIGDVHIGGHDFNKDFFEYVLNWTIKTKNVYVIGMGDYLEIATKKSPTNVFKQKYDGTKQKKILRKYFKPLVEQNKLLGMLMGNHEYRLMRFAGYDVIDDLCDEFEIPYLGIGEFIQTNIHRNGDIQEYIIYGSHGASGAHTPGGKINAMYKQSFSIGAELYLSGHTHDLAVHKESRYIVENGKRKMVTMYFVNTGHFTQWWGSYAQMKGYPIGNFGSPKIKLHGTKHRISVNI